MKSDGVMVDDDMGALLSIRKADILMLGER